MLDMYDAVGVIATDLQSGKAYGYVRLPASSGLVWVSSERDVTGTVYGPTRSAVEQQLCDEMRPGVRKR